MAKTTFKTPDFTDDECNQLTEAVNAALEACKLKPFSPIHYKNLYGTNLQLIELLDRIAVHDLFGSDAKFVQAEIHITKAVPCIHAENCQFCDKESVTCMTGYGVCGKKRELTNQKRGGR